MTDNHPITPPPELLEVWCSLPLSMDEVLVIAVQWGANQELEACCEWVSKYLPYLGDFPMPEDKLRAARRPKPPSLKEQALQEVDALEGMGTCNIDIIRRALEALPE